MVDESNAHEKWYQYVLMLSAILLTSQSTLTIHPDVIAQAVLQAYSKIDPANTSEPYASIGSHLERTTESSAELKGYFNSLRPSMMLMAFREEFVSKAMTWDSSWDDRALVVFSSFVCGELAQDKERALIQLKNITHFQIQPSTKMYFPEVSLADAVKRFVRTTRHVHAFAMCVGSVVGVKSSCSTFSFDTELCRGILHRHCEMKIIEKFGTSLPDGLGVSRPCCAHCAAEISIKYDETWTKFFRGIHSSRNGNNSRGIDATKSVFSEDCKMSYLTNQDWNDNDLPTEVPKELARNDAEVIIEQEEIGRSTS